MKLLLHDEKQIKAFRMGTLISTSLIILLSMIGMFFTYETAYFSDVLTIIAIIMGFMLFLLTISVPYYVIVLRRKICITEDGIMLYSGLGKIIREYRYAEYSHVFHKITFIYANVNASGFDRTSECLVLYRDMELYEGMEYRDYWNDKNILIIQNPEAIAEVEKYI